MGAQYSQKSVHRVKVARALVQEESALEPTLRVDETIYVVD